MISILMPIYNGIEFIDESVSSVLAQTYKDWELIIGINGHPENSDVYAIAKKFEDKAPIKIKVLDLYTITGKANALNEMVNHCKYNFIAILDVDDIWVPNKLEIQSECLDVYDVIGSQCIYFGEINGITPQIPFGDISDFDFFSVNPVINSSSIIRKELCHWEENGIEDYDLWLKLRCESRSFFNFTNILVKHRIHKASAFNSKGTHLKVPDLLKKHRK